MIDANASKRPKGTNAKIGDKEVMIPNSNFRSKLKYVGDTNIGTLDMMQLRDRLRDSQSPIAKKIYKSGIVHAAAFPPTLPCPELIMECASRLNIQRKSVMMEGEKVLANISSPLVEDTFNIPKQNSTLQDLQLDYIDLYLMHWPNADISSTWMAMEKLVDTGRVRAIGVSNFSSKKLQDMLAYAKVVPAVNQVERHPVWQQHNLQAFCKSKGIHVTAYSPLGSPGTGWFKVKVKVLEHPVLKEVAKELGKTPAQVALRWGVQSGYSVLPKSSNEDRIKENFDIFDWSIPQELFDKFSQIEQVRLLQGDFLVNKTRGPFKSLEDLWDGEI